MEIKYLTEQIDDMKDSAEAQLLKEFSDNNERFTSSFGSSRRPPRKHGFSKNRGRDDEDEKVKVRPDSDIDIFSGEIYKDKSRLRNRKFSVFTKARKTPLTGKFGKFEPVFIIGYELQNPDLMFELWYDALTGNYGIFDKFGGAIGPLNSVLEDTVDELIDIIAKEERVRNTREEKDFEREAEKVAKQKTKRADRFFDSKQYKEDYDYVHMIIENAKVTKDFLFRSINDQVVTYDETRMDRRQISKFWELFLGRNLDFPSKFLPGEDAFGRFAQRVRKVFGAEKEATFVIGFTFADKIDFEIWFVKGDDGNRFFVFDLNSGRIIGKQLKSLRQAYQALARKLALPEEDIEDEANKELRR